MMTIVIRLCLVFGVASFASIILVSLLAWRRDWVRSRRARARADRILGQDER